MQSSYDTGYTYTFKHDEKNKKITISVTKNDGLESLIDKELNKYNKDSKIVDITKLTNPKSQNYDFTINYSNKKDLYKLVSNDPIVLKGNKYTMNDPNGHLLGFINLYADKPVIVINEDIIRDMESFMKVWYHELMHTFFRDETINRVVTDTVYPEKIVNNSKYAA